MNEQKQKGSSWNVVLMVIGGWAATIYPFMRKNIGKNHPGIRGLIGLGWVFLWIAYTQAEGLVWLIPIYLIGLISNKIGHAQKPLGVHSDYSGDPFLAMKIMPFKDPDAAKRIGEPLISLAVGLALIACGFDEGKYFAFGAAALAGNQTLIDWYYGRRIDEMRDGMIENDYLMGRVRKEGR